MRLKSNSNSMVNYVNIIIKVVIDDYNNNYNN